MAFVREITHPGRGFDRQVAKLWENRGASDSYDPEKWEDAHVDERVHGAAAASVPRELEDLCVRRHVRICPSQGSESRHGRAGKIGPGKKVWVSA